MNEYTQHSSDRKRQTNIQNSVYNFFVCVYNHHTRYKTDARKKNTLCNGEKKGYITNDVEKRLIILYKHTHAFR